MPPQRSEQPDQERTASDTVRQLHNHRRFRAWVAYTLVEPLPVRLEVTDVHNFSIAVSAEDSWKGDARIPASAKGGGEKRIGVEC